ncbi:MAG: glycosyltransferase family 9 protein [Elusimicrobia bacterium]|nr:glycosyltransferase family 9 protein [Elusimicrobiota bacterium]
MGLKKYIKEVKRNFAKVIFDKRASQNVALDFANVKKIVFLRHDDKLGDMIISTILFREIKKARPDIKLIVLSGKNNKEIIEANPYVDEICEWSRASVLKNIKTLWALRKQKIDVAVDFYIFKPMLAALFILRFVNAAFNIGFNKKGYNLYSHALNVDINNTHISLRYKALLDYLGIKTDNLKYEIFLMPEEEDKAQEFIKHIKQKHKIVLNPFAASRHRTFSNVKIMNIIEGIKAQIPDSAVIIISPLRRRNSVQNLHSYYKDFVFTPMLNTARDACAIVKYSSLMITPDTSLVHAARAYNSKMVAVYLDYSNTSEKINEVWGAQYDNAISLNVNSEGSWLKNNVDSIDTQLLIDTVKELLYKQG